LKTTAVDLTEVKLCICIPGQYAIRKAYAYIIINILRALVQKFKTAANCTVTNLLNCSFKYMLLSLHHNAGQNRDIKIANRSFGNVSQFKYLGTTVTIQNLIQKEIKRRLNSGKAYYHSVQNLLSSRLLSKNLKIRIFKTIILPVVLYGCET
jgi:hypothetical protein